MDEEYFAGKERKGHVRQKEQHNRGSEAPVIEPRVERDGGGGPQQLLGPHLATRGQGPRVSGWAVGEPMTGTLRS